MRIVQVLVIEDDRDARSNIVEILRSDGFGVLEAVDGESGLKSALEIGRASCRERVLMPV